MKVEGSSARFLSRRVMEMSGAALAALPEGSGWEKGVIRYRSDFSHVNRYRSLSQLCQNSGFGTLRYLLEVCRPKGQNWYT